MLQYDVTTPRPYSRINLVQGSRGCFWGYGFPARLYLTKGKPGTESGKDWMSRDEYEKYAAKYRHPLWRSVGGIAKKVGGHGGMDFIMDLRWAYCLQNGLPLDTDVYDLATYSSVVELSERSINARSSAIDFPDFTRGGWKTAKPFDDAEMDMSRFDFKKDVINSKNAQKT